MMFSSTCLCVMAFPHFPACFAYDIAIQRNYVIGNVKALKVMKMTIAKVSKRYFLQLHFSYVLD